MAELSKRIELLILMDDDGSEVVAECRLDGLIEVVTASNLELARTWVEVHYAEIDWLKPRCGANRTARPAIRRNRARRSGRA